MSAANPKRNLRHALKSLVPNWLADRPALRFGFTVLYVIALYADLLLEGMWQGLASAFPGAGTPTALALIGQGRALIRGSVETDDEYSARLRDWLNVWPEAGSDETLLTLLQNYLGGSLKMRLVTRAGNFTTIETDGTFTYATDGAWNFDETELPARSTWFSDIWLIVYLDTRWPSYTSLTDTAWTAAWGVSNLGLGHQVPRNIVNDLYSIIAVFKGPHTFLEAIVWTTDTALFVPGSLGSTYPNGRWGNWSRDNAGAQVAARPVTSGAGVLRFWTPKTGG